MFDPNVKNWFSPCGHVKTENDIDNNKDYISRFLVVQLSEKKKKIKFFPFLVQILQSLVFFYFCLFSQLLVQRKAALSST